MYSFTNSLHPWINKCDDELVTLTGFEEDIVNDYSAGYSGIVVVTVIAVIALMVLNRRLGKITSEEAEFNAVKALKQRLAVNEITIGGYKDLKPVLKNE